MDLISLYGSVEAARQRYNGLMVLGRAPTDEEAQETADLLRALAMLDEQGQPMVPVPGTNTDPVLNAERIRATAIRAGHDAVFGHDADGKRDEKIARDVEEWARERKTPRDLLCVAATASGWELQPEFSDPTCVDGATYDLAIEGAKKLLNDVSLAPKLAGKGRKGMVVLTIPGQLVAVILKRLDAKEAKKVISELRDDNEAISDNAQGQMMQRQVLWPTGEALDAIKDAVPLAWLESWPKSLLEAAGINASKKKR